MEMVGMDVALPTIERFMDHVYHSCSHCLPRGIYWPSFWALRLTRQADKVQVTLQNLDTGASRGERRRRRIISSTSSHCGKSL